MDTIAQSPCIRSCCLSDDEICLGCFRSLQDIEHWNEADNQERLSILQKARQRQEAYKLHRTNPSADFSPR